MGVAAKLSLICFVVYITSLTGATAFQCEKENIFGIETEFDCPRFGQDENKIFCCGKDSNVHCCAAEDMDLSDAAEVVGKIIGAVLGMIVFLLIVCVVCCCCCPFCLLAKRRQRGVILTANPAQPQGTTMTSVTIQPGQPQQPQPGYPQAQYAPQPQFPQQPQPGYPQPGYPGAPAPGYPQPAPGYPAEQPPAYAEKPAAFNPNY